MELKRTDTLLRQHNWIALVITIAAMCFVSNPLLFQGSIVHISPQFGAGDAYYHASFAKYIQDSGYYNSQPSYLTAGNPEKLTATEPPLFLYLNAEMAYLLSIPYYDASVFCAFIVLLSGVMALYLLSNHIHPMLPYFSLPPAILQAEFPFVSGIFWGFWKSYFSMVLLFIAIAVFIMTKRSLKNSIFVGILLAAVIIAHSISITYVLVAFGAFVAHGLASKRIKETAIHLSVIASVAAALSMNYLIDFYYAWLTDPGAISFFGLSYQMYGATPQLADLGILFFIGAAGFVMAFLLRKKWRSLEITACCFGAFFILLLLGPLLNGRIYQLRLIWPFFISIFVGIFFLSEFHFLGIKKRLPYLLSFIVFILLAEFVVAGNLHPADVNHDYKLLDDSYWNALSGMSYKEGARVYIIDPMLVQSTILPSTHSYTRYLWKEDFEQNSSVDSPSSIYCQVPYYVRTGFLSGKPCPDCQSYCEKKFVPLCSFDYFILRAGSTESEETWTETQLNVIIKNLNTSVHKTSSTTTIIENEEVCPA